MTHLCDYGLVIPSYLTPKLIVTYFLGFITHAEFWAFGVINIKPFTIFHLFLLEM